MSLRTLMRILRGGAVLVLIASSLLVACTEGTTPDCSGNPSPCGNEPPADAGKRSEGGE